MKEDNTSPVSPQGMPESVKDIAKQLAECARSLGLLEFSGKFRPEHSVWGAEVSFHWRDGRQGEESNQIQITSTFYIHERVR